MFYTNIESRNSKIIQTQLLLQYQYLLNIKAPLPDFQDTGFRVYSQCDEDGLLLYLFSLVGTINKICIDIAYGSPFGANTTNLICNWGWTGLLIEGNSELVKKSQEFFRQHKDTWLHPPCIIKTWVTAENINDLIKNNGISGEIDLFCLDIDGIEYWLWKSLKVIKPRVVIVEYNNFWPADKSVTVPYKPDFNRFDIHPDFCGASLLALFKLAREKGYRLVGTNKYGFNAFFVRYGIGEDIFPEISVDKCLRHPQAKDGQKKRLPEVLKYDWVEV